MKVGVLSDTHGLLRNEVMEILQGCDLIFHAGDISKQEIIDQLNTIAPTLFVRGNNDKAWAEHLPEFLTEKVQECRVFMVHNKKGIPADLRDVNIVIFGHTHKYMEKWENGVLFLNPGSCGPRSLKQEITLAVLNIDAKNVQVQKVIIPHKENEKRNIVPSDLGAYMSKMIKDMASGKNKEQIAKKYKISEELSEQILRMYYNHPGIDADGILQRLGL